ncbi:MAG TPA: glucuronate isomerase, partial [Pirellulaceae bacterium]|nr:glucuronate isomerase [Pirellulaceae bacterium]
MTWIDDHFLLTNNLGKRLYHEFVVGEPICDRHSHLDPHDFAHDRRFENLYELWLVGDHYKWRAMRAAGISEHYITGPASPFEKFSAWSATVPKLLGNALHHWTHLELLRLFGVSELLDETSA